MVPERRAQQAKYYLEIFLVAFAIILLEISFTRIFSFKVFYYFTYLIIGIALLGLGSGGVLLAVVERLKRARPERLVALLCSLASAAVPISYVVVATVQLNVSGLTQDAQVEVPKLLLICLSLFVPFLLGGLAVAAIFTARPQQINRLYAADLVGAGLACSLILVLLRWLTPPGAVILSGLVFALAALPLASRSWRALLPVPAAFGIAAIALLTLPGALPEPVPDRGKAVAPDQLAEPGVELVHSEWDPVFRVDVKRVPGPLGPQDLLVHDGLVGSSITRWDGDERQVRALFETRAPLIPFRVLGEAPSVLILGAAGGRQILASLAFGAREITAVELNPVTVRLMKEEFAADTRAFLEDERVTLLNAEGRNFLSQSDQRYDLIWLVAPDTYAAMNAASAGAFVLSESYLYTVEMINEAFDHLTEGGLLCAQFGDIDFINKPKRTVRFLSTAREALRTRGVDAFERHVLVATAPSHPWPASTILVKQTPFTAEDVSDFEQAVLQLSREKPGAQTIGEAFRTRAIVWHPRPGSSALNRVISLPDDALIAWRKTSPYDVAPVHDDSPFFWHFVRFRDAFQREWGRSAPVWDPEEATGERTLIVLLAFTIVFAAAMILLPLIAIRGVWRELPARSNALVYFSALGLGFMFFEVTLIQQLTLFLGYPTYSLSVTLFAILLSTGAGSFLTERYARDRNRSLFVLLGALIVLTVWYRYGLGPVVDALSGLPPSGRAIVAVALVTPLGLVLGAFMPIGLATVSAGTAYKQEIIAWSWAVNGFASVVASVLSTMLSMTIGFRGVQLAAIGLYAVGVLALSRVPFRARDRAPDRGPARSPARTGALD